LQVFGVLAAPFLFRKLGLVSGIASTQLAAAVLLGLLAATSGPLSAAIVYVSYTGFLWMSEPGLFTLLMDRVAPGEQTGASSLNFLVISASQAIAVAMTGSAFLRTGYPVSLAAIAALAAISAGSFWLLLGPGVLQSSQTAESSRDRFTQTAVGAWAKKWAKWRAGRKCGSSYLGENK